MYAEVILTHDFAMNHDTRSQLINSPINLFRKENILTTLVHTNASIGLTAQTILTNLL